MAETGVAKRVRAVVEPIINDLGLELVLVEFFGARGRSVLRLTIDGPNGVGLDDCERVTRAVDAPLDEADPISGSYTLEVSSPGLDRPLVRRADYERFAGHEVRLQTYAPIDGRKNWTGTLVGLDGDDVLLKVDDTQARLPLAQVSKARLVPKF